MPLYQVNAGDRILAADINQFYNIFKGVAASGEAVTLIYNAAGSLVIQPSSDPVANTQMIQVKNNAGTVKSALTSDGNIVAVAETLTGDITETLSVGASGTVQNKNLWTVTATPDATTQEIRAHMIDMRTRPTASYPNFPTALYLGNWHDTGAFNLTNGLRGIQVQINQGVGATTVTDARALEVNVSAVAGTITNAIGLDVIRGSGGDAGAITTSLGLWVHAPTAVTPTNDIAIQTDSGDLRHAGFARVGSNNPAAAVLHVSGTSPLAAMYFDGTVTTSGTNAASIWGINTNLTPGANTENLYGALIGGVAAVGAFTGITATAIRAFAMSKTGAGTVLNAYALSLDKPTIATNNYYMLFNTADNTDPTGGGLAAVGRLPVSIAGTLRYIPYY